jgi:flagellar protein FlaJ
MMFFSTLLAFIFGIFLGIGLFFAGINWAVILLIIIILPAAAFIFFYSYPSTQRKSLEKEINQELPFVTIYMSAIATSGIEPSKIFNILVVSKDYPFIQREVKKLNNYINFYGYDLTSALKTAGKSCPSEKLAQLFDGLATTISSGGEIQEFLNKHSETLLFDYRLEREKYTHVAETFMNIYISVVIAAPMIMMMLFILMSLTGFATGFLSPTNIGLLTVLVISMLNIGFIVFLNMKQPKF